MMASQVGDPSHCTSLSSNIHSFSQSLFIRSSISPNTFRSETKQKRRNTQLVDCIRQSLIFGSNQHKIRYSLQGGGKEKQKQHQHQQQVVVVGWVGGSGTLDDFLLQCRLNEQLSLRKRSQSIARRRPTLCRRKSTKVAQKERERNRKRRENIVRFYQPSQPFF